MGGLSTRLVVGLFLGWGLGVAADEQAGRNGRGPGAALQPEILFAELVGRWEGTSRTWFEPGKLADESKVTGEFSPALDGLFLPGAGAPSTS